MPLAVPPAAFAQQQPAGDAEAGGLIEQERTFWLAPIRARPRERAPCPAARGDEIVVCAPIEDDPARDRLGAPLPDPPTLAQEWARKTTLSFGPAQAHPTIGVSPGIPELAPDFGVTIGIKF